MRRTTVIGAFVTAADRFTLEGSMSGSVSTARLDADFNVDVAPQIVADLTQASGPYTISDTTQRSSNAQIRAPRICARLVVHRIHDDRLEQRDRQRHGRRSWSDHIAGHGGRRSLP